MNILKVSFELADALFDGDEPSAETFVLRLLVVAGLLFAFFNVVGWVLSGFLFLCTKLDVFYAGFVGPFVQWVLHLFGG